MNKLDLKNMDFCPPRKWLAVPKNEDYAPQTFSLDDIGELEDGRLEFWPKEGLPLWPKWIRLFACHLCGFTGYCDSKGEEVYGGHILRSFIPDGDKQYTVYHRVFWSAADGGWRFKNIKLKSSGRLSDYMSAARDVDRHIEIIGHIHQPDQWPEEVRGLLG